MKIISKFKALFLSSIIFACLSACSPKEEQGVDIQALIPEDCDAAFYAKTNENIIKELKAIPEYKEIIAELKKYNRTLSEKYLELVEKAELNAKKKSTIDAIISSDNIIGSIEELATSSDVSVAVYTKDTMISVMGGVPNILVAIKIGNASLAEKTLALLDAQAQDLGELAKKSKVDSFDLFTFKSTKNNEENLRLYVLKAKDTFIITMQKDALDSALSEIKSPTVSVLDSPMFKSTITEPNSDCWFYINDKILNIIATMNGQPAIIKSFGVEIKTESLQSATLSLKANLNENEYTKLIFESYTEFKGENPVKNIYDDSAFFLSAKLPNSGKGFDILATKDPFLAMLATPLKQLTCIEIALSNDDIKGISSSNEMPTMLANVYAKSTKELLALLAANKKNANGLEYFELPEANLAKISDSQIAISNNKKDFANIVNIASSNKVNSKISKALSEIPSKNCIIEAYIDLNAMQESTSSIGAQSLPPLLTQIQSLSREITKKNEVAAKLSLQCNALSLVAKTNSQYDYNAMKDMLALILANSDSLIKELIPLN